MKPALKSILLTAFLTIVAFAAVVHQSCTQDKCKAVTCAYGGVCNDGNCICMPGYEGSTCETISRKKFISNLWEVDEQGTVSPHRKYPVAIEPDTSVQWVTLNNFYNYFPGKKIRARIDRDTIIIPNQQVSDKVVVGKGYITSSADGVNDMIVLRYTVIDAANRNLVDDFGYNVTLANSKPSIWKK